MQDPESLNLKSFLPFHAVSKDFTVRITEGRTGYLPCFYPCFSQVTANALWFKGTSQLNLEDNSAENDRRIEHIFPLDKDQTIVLRDTVSTDAGMYFCKTAEGETLSTVHTIIEGTFINPSLRYVVAANGKLALK